MINLERKKKKKNCQNPSVAVNEKKRGVGDEKKRADGDDEEKHVADGIGDVVPENECRAVVY